MEDDQSDPRHVAITITGDMHRKINEPPRLLSSAAGNPACSIFRIPTSLSEVNGKVYDPHIVSIGPFRRGEPRLKMIEEHKWRYLGTMLDRLADPGKLTELLTAVSVLERRARDCYAEEIGFSSEEFSEMLVLDGCFIIELFRKADNLVPWERDDPIFNMAWIVPFMYRDLLRLENQIPYFVLERIFDLTRPVKDSSPENDYPSLSLLSLRFFNHVTQRPDEIIERCRDLEAEHLLDLVRTSMIPGKQVELRQRGRDTPTHIIHCVSKLRRAGIKLNQGSDESFLVVRFRRGVLEMPPITIDDFMASFLQNCVAYEQCRAHCSKHFTTYATLLDCLVNTYHDVEYLCDRNIIENCFGNDGEVARFLNGLGKDIAFDVDICYLADLFNDVHGYYRNSWHVQWAGFKYTYFDTPWSFISALAALVLLALTVAQTFYTAYGFYNGGK